MSAINEKLFENYASTHAGIIDGTHQQQQVRADTRSNLNYPAILPTNKNAKILEIGCNKGYFLHWLRSRGYTDLTGVDLSPGDIAAAKEYTKLPELYCTDGIDFIADKPGIYDVIVFRAVFEHIEKQYSESFLQAVGKAIKPDGKILIEVPNMDWFMAHHERYMDFTHEVGFTRESLGQLLRLLFENVEIRPVHEGYFSFAGMIRIKILKPIVKKIMGAMFAIMGEGANDMWWANRAILAIASKPKK